jgi:hypothetical protein
VIVEQRFAVKRDKVALSYTIDKESRLVTTTAWDTLTADQVLEHQRQLQNDPAFDPDFSQLADLTLVVHLQMDARTVMELSDIVLFSAESRRAFIADNPFHYGMARMFAAFHKLSGEDQIRVFTTRDAALQWLNVTR